MQAAEASILSLFSRLNMMVWPHLFMFLLYLSGNKKEVNTYELP